MSDDIIPLRPSARYRANAAPDLRDETLALLVAALSALTGRTPESIAPHVAVVPARFGNAVECTISLRVHPDDLPAMRKAVRRG